MHSMPSFCTGARDPNPGPRAYEAGTLPTKATPPPLPFLAVLFLHRYQGSETN